MRALAEDFKQKAAQIHKSAIRSLFDRFSSLCDGAMAIDVQGRIAWINAKYATLLGLESIEAAIGQPVEEVIPNSLMRQVVETGEPILLDILQVGQQALVVTRMPLLDDDGAIIGAIGFVIYDKPHYLKPLMTKFANLQNEVARMQQVLAQSRSPRYTLANYVGTNPLVVEVKRQIRRAAAQDATVLLLGETGTGKELIAQAIHGSSARARMPMIAVNIAAIPDTLIESEMFGVAAGAYTGADRRGRLGKFQIADGGTLFLDEIGDMPLPLQAKLLRALQEQEIEPLGSNQLTKIDVRIIAATNVDLFNLVVEKKFRADLYYRLNVVTIRLPPLRDIASDIEAIANTILEQIAAQSGAPLRSLSPSGLAALWSYDWPGNVRELRNILERACVMTESLQLTAEDFAGLPPPGTAQPSLPPAPGGVVPLAAAVDALERGLIRSALQAADGKADKAAALLGISRAAIYRKAQRLGLSLKSEI